MVKSVTLPKLVEVLVQRQKTPSTAVNPGRVTHPETLDVAILLCKRGDVYHSRVSLMSLVEFSQPREATCPSQAIDDAGSLIQNNLNPPPLHLTMAVYESSKESVSQMQLVQGLHPHNDGDINEFSPYLLGHYKKLWHKQIKRIRIWRLFGVRQQST